MKDPVYTLIELTGTSTTSIEDAVDKAIKRAQKTNHHLDIDIRFDRVTLALSTHDEGGITEKDFSLARQCDEVFSPFVTSWSTQIPSPK